MKAFGKALILTTGIFCGYFDALVSSKKISVPAAFIKSIGHAAGSFFKYFGKV